MLAFPFHTRDKVIVTLALCNILELQSHHFEIINHFQCNKKNSINIAAQPKVMCNNCYYEIDINIQKLIILVLWIGSCRLYILINKLINKVTMQYKNIQCFKFFV